MLQKFAHHSPHVKMLGKKWCGALRRALFSRTVNALGESHHDYSERMQGKYQWEIQAGHFGYTASLSIEGCTILQFDLSKLAKYEAGEVGLEELQQSIRMDMHSYFSDDSKQDAACSHDNMECLIKRMLAEGRFAKHGPMPHPTLFDNTDGCASQYRCGNALFLLSLLASAYGIVIDRAIGAPGHGKDLIDGMNAVDKRFLQEAMRRLAKAAGDEESNRMEPSTMVEGEAKSLAAECIRLCSDKSRAEGVKSAGKYAKREGAAPMRERHYHPCEPTATFAGIQMEVAHGLPKAKKGEKYNGLRAMYHQRQEADLGIKRAAVRRIPCGCEGCYEGHLLKPGPWQERYKPHTDCVHHLIYEDLNDWHIVTLRPKTSAAEEQVEDAKMIVVQSTSREIATKIKEGGIGAFSTDDPDADGYYVVKWIGEPFSLEEACTLDSFDPPQNFKRGELVVYATYFNKVERAPFWYTPMDTSDTVLIKVTHDVAADLSLLENSVSNPLPRGCNKREAINKGAKNISEADHDIIHEQIARNILVEYVDDNIDYESEDDEADYDSDLD